MMHEDISDELTNEGIDIVRELLREWGEGSVDHDQDVLMRDADDVDAEVVELRRCIEKLRPRMEHNPWFQSLIAAL